MSANLSDYFVDVPVELKSTFGGVSAPVVAWKYGFSLNPK
jgi:hypothetical protein